MIMLTHDHVQTLFGTCIGKPAYGKYFGLYWLIAAVNFINGMYHVNNLHFYSPKANN